MERNLTKIRMLAAAGALAIVAAATLGLGSYSNAKFAIAQASAAQPHAAQPVQLAIEPSRIDVVGTRLARTPNVAHVNEAPVRRPQS